MFVRREKSQQTNHNENSDCISIAMCMDFLSFIIHYAGIENHPIRVEKRR